MFILNPITGKIDYITGSDKKEYIAKLSQVETDAPTAVVIKDTIPSPLLARTAAGTYTVTKAGAFTANKTTPDKLEYMYDVDGNYITIERTSADVITIKTYAAADTSVLADGILTNQLIIIEIYS